MTIDDGPTMRQRILNLVQEYPGLHLREVARQLETSVALIEYHVEGLVKDSAVERIIDNRHHRLFPHGHQLPSKALMTLRDSKSLKVVLHLLQSPATHSELVKHTGFGKSTLSFHLRRMERAGLIAKDGSKYALLEPETVRALVANNRPTPDLLSRFANLWDDLYDG
jgi:predicted transcriptional regulator